MASETILHFLFLQRHHNSLE